MSARPMGGVEVVLLDADDNLFPSEVPAFEASAEVVNRFLARFGSALSYSPDALRRIATGRSFRSLATDLAAAHGFPLDGAELDDWVAQERIAVTAHLGRVLRPDPRVISAVQALSSRYRLAVVSSSALSRLDACFSATGLSTLLLPASRFSAEDSLSVPTSKPDPAIYLHACEVLGVAPGRAVAVEDSVAGIRSAVVAGCAALGNVTFVAEPERLSRSSALAAAGASGVCASWEALLGLLLDPAHAPAGSRVPVPSGGSR